MTGFRDGMFTDDEIRDKFVTGDTFSRREVAFALSDPDDQVHASQVTRDIQTLYGNSLDRQSVTRDVLINLYLIRLFRIQYRVSHRARCRIRKEDLVRFINKFNENQDSESAKWKFAEQLGCGKDHFQKNVIDRILASRRNRIDSQTITIENLI